MGAWALEHSRHSGTWALEALYLADTLFIDVNVKGKLIFTIPCD